MASIKRHGNGWRAYVCYKGKRPTATFRTRREAEAWAARKETELRNIQQTAPGLRYTLAEVLKKYQDEIMVSHRGYNREKFMIDLFMKMEFVNLPIATITTAMLTAWKEERLKSVKTSTCRREFNLLSSIFEAARREWQYILVNPVRDVRKPPSLPDRERVITWWEILAILRAMKYRGQPARSVSAAVAVCFKLALRTGMRAGELCKLKWTDIHDGYCYLPVTKTVPRAVPLTWKALRIIEMMRGWDEEYVFGLKTQTLDANFRKYRDKAGLTGFTFHDSRHTAATWIAGQMKSSNIPAQQAILDFCKIFGWKDVNRALTYFNPDPKDIAARMAKKPA